MTDSEHQFRTRAAAEAFARLRQMGFEASFSVRHAAAMANAALAFVVARGYALESVRVDWRHVTVDGVPMELELPLNAQEALALKRRKLALLTPRDAALELTTQQLGEMIGSAVQAKGPRKTRITSKSRQLDDGSTSTLIEKETLE